MHFGRAREGPSTLFKWLAAALCLASILGRGWARVELLRQLLQVSSNSQQIVRLLALQVMSRYKDEQAGM